MPEGELTKLRASIVCEPTLAICAKEIGLHEMVYLGKGEELTGGRFRDSIISDAFEALIGAIYKDGGIECATGFVEKFVLQDIDNKKLFVDSKSILQERIQAQTGSTLCYKLISETGPEHDKNFEVAVYINDKCMATAVGHNKKDAEQHAAYQVLKQMQDE